MTPAVHRYPKFVACQSVSQSSSIDIRHLRSFISTFKNKSFSQASEELKITQPTISSHVKALEKELSCKLFHRVGKTILLSKEAEILYEYSVEITEEIDALKAALRAIKKEPSGHLIVGASKIPGVYLLPPIMSEFKKKYTRTIFQIVISGSTEVIDSIAKHKLSIGVVGAKFDDAQIKYIPFVDDLLIAVSSPPLVKNRMTLRELATLPIVLGEAGSGTRREMEKFLTDRGISVDSLKIAGSTDAVKQTVKAGLGVSILSKYSVADELKQGTLKEIKLTDAAMKRTFYIAIHKERTLSPLYDAFVSHLTKKTNNRHKILFP
jgi:DNA-binding transcriptional LysR family regulator